MFQIYYTVNCTDGKGDNVFSPCHYTYTGNDRSSTPVSNPIAYSFYDCPNMNAECAFYGVDVITTPSNYYWIIGGVCLLVLIITCGFCGVIIFEKLRRKYCKNWEYTKY